MSGSYITSCTRCKYYKAILILGKKTVMACTYEGELDTDGTYCTAREEVDYAGNSDV